MKTHVTQVSRTYRTQALWYAYAEEQASKQTASKQTSRPQGPRDRGSDGTAASFGRDGFDEHAAGLARSMTAVLGAARRLQQAADKRPDDASADEAKPAAEPAGADLTGAAASPAGAAAGGRLLDRMQELVDGYNALHSAIRDSTPPFKNGTGDAVTGGLAQFPLQELGVRPQPDGSWRLDREALEAQAAANYGRPQPSLRGPDGLAAAISDAAGKLLAMPPSQLLEPQQSLFRSYANYRTETRVGSPIRTYLPLPLTGILFDRGF
ncbi:hypothetical protein [Paenibacillus piri]|uniref:Uncharacterized protein n=1 Tax=Paenibacillus piri TaxID=2547395 RepID=A0A4R5KCK1_9BACL|nr:hypothetical protein [Paenibacillus piri]TDF91847.1 hypothetical protein E1757_31390 [Paenibacillus piri]